MGRPAEDLTGRKFNYLTVIRRATEEECPRGTGKAAQWLCKCDCGNTRFVRSNKLKSGEAVSCGCKNREKAKQLAAELGHKKLIDLTGKKFGKLTVLKRSHNKNNQVHWLCQCECGTIKEVSSQNLRTGHTTSCGCNKQWGEGRISKGEETIIKILKENKINFEREKTFTDMKIRGNNLRLDFYLPEQNIGLEFNGIAHYEQNNFFHKTRQDFLKRQEYDRYKIGYCLAHNITLYCIPYWELDNLKNIDDVLNPKFIAKDRWKNDQDWQYYKKI